MHFSHRLTIDIKAPAQEVWRVLADYARDPEWREGVSMRHAPSGLVRDGTRTEESLRMLGSLHHTEAVISDVRPEHSFRFLSRDGRVEGSRSVRTEGLHSRVEVAIRVRPPLALGWLTPLLGFLFRKRVTRDLRRLRELVEQACATRAPC